MAKLNSPGSIGCSTADDRANDQANTRTASSQEPQSKAPEALGGSKASGIPDMLKELAVAKSKAAAAKVSAAVATQGFADVARAPGVSSGQEGGADGSARSSASVSPRSAPPRSRARATRNSEVLQWAV